MTEKNIRERKFVQEVSILLEELLQNPKKVSELNNKLAGEKVALDFGVIRKVVSFTDIQLVCKKGRLYITGESVKKKSKKEKLQILPGTTIAKSHEKITIGPHIPKRYYVQ